MKTKTPNVLIFQRGDCKSRTALDFVAAIANQSTDSEVHIVDIQPKLTEFWDDLLERDFDQQQSQIRIRQLRELADLIDDNLVTFCEVLSGSPVSQLVQYIQSNRIDLVVKVGGGNQSSVLSSLDHRLVRQCCVGVAIVRNQPLFVDPNNPVILVAINPIEDAAERAMNIRLLHAGAILAERFGGRLNVVSAVKPPSIQWAHNDEAIEDCQRVEKRALSRGRESLSQILEASRVVVAPSKIKLEFCQPEELILRQVTSLKSDLLVMGSVVRSWSRGLLIGSVTDRASHALPCSLVAIRPEEAISTVADQLKLQKVQ